MKSCDHSGLHSGVGRYSRKLGAIRFVVICDACGRERRELLREPYEPHFEPHAATPPAVPERRAA